MCGWRRMLPSCLRAPFTRLQLVFAPAAVAHVSTELESTISLCVFTVSKFCGQSVANETKQFVYIVHIFAEFGCDLSACSTRTIYGLNYIISMDLVDSPRLPRLRHSLFTKHTNNLFWWRNECVVGVLRADWIIERAPEPSFGNWVHSQSHSISLLL